VALQSTVRAGCDAHDAVSQADVVLSMVTAEQTLAAARSVASSLAPEAFFVDVNSVSPEVKQQAAGIIEARDARYVEAAVMAAFPTQRLAVPIYLGGPHAGEFLPIAHALGLHGASVFSNQIGPASAAKMCRSIIIKGMEALLLESMLAARHYGVEQVVLDSLKDLQPSDWRAQSRYMISRALLHGRRRAEEMYEVCRTVTAAQLTPIMSTAIAERQAWAADYRSAANQPSLQPLLDSIRTLTTQPTP
jgi:3-hydroxyisobutyrate dehydrogenase-like beta-hydroxyacid dehydrogenase